MLQCNLLCTVHCFHAAHLLKCLRRKLQLTLSQVIPISFALEVFPVCTANDQLTANSC